MYTIYIDTNVTTLTGPCSLNQAPVLGGKEILSDTYPQHGSIQLEKLPLGTESIILTRGDSISTPEAGLSKKKLRVLGNPKSVSRLPTLNMTFFFLSAFF